MRIGSVCSGYEGLGMAVQEVLGGELVFVADNDPGASAILAHRFPSVPNLGDITTTDWAAVEPVDILAGGLPCQPVSAAGRHKGTGDERWLFDDFAAAIGRMVARPRLLVLENVPGLLSANGGDAMARIVQGLAALGYVGRYRLLRASDAGAPHRRERWFCIAWPAEDADGAASDEWREPAPGQAASWRPRADAGRSGGALAADPRSEGLEVRAVEPDRHERQAAERGRGDAAAHAAVCGRDGGVQHAVEPGSAGRRGQAEGDARRGDLAASNSERDRLGGRRSAAWANEGRAPAASIGRRPSDSGAVIDWGDYGPAVRRWGRILGRAAPRPTEPGRTGERLSPVFVEWMQGLPAGWVTGVPGLSRKHQLHALGNGVVPQQAAMALRMLLERADIAPLVAAEGAA